MEVGFLKIVTLVSHIMWMQPLMCWRYSNTMAFYPRDAKPLRLNPMGNSVISPEPTCGGSGFEIRK